MKKMNLVVAAMILLLSPLSRADETSLDNHGCEIQSAGLNQPDVEAALTTLVHAGVLGIKNGVIVEKQGSALDKIKQSDRWTVLNFEQSVVCF